jgi:hypothetical protein
LKVQGLKFKEMNEIEYNGLNRVLGSNPAGLHVYRKKQHPENTIPVGIAQPMVVWHFYKHMIPLASLLPPKNRCRLLISINGKETTVMTTAL